MAKQWGPRFERVELLVCRNMRPPPWFAGHEPPHECGRRVTLLLDGKCESCWMPELTREEHLALTVEIPNRVYSAISAAIMSGYHPAELTDGEWRRLVKGVGKKTVSEIRRFFPAPTTDRIRELEAELAAAKKALQESDPK